MSNISGLHLQQRQNISQEMRLNQFQQQSLHFLQSGVAELFIEIEELRKEYPELKWKEGAPVEWEQGNIELQKSKRYNLGKWLLEENYTHYLSSEELSENSDSKQQMLENYTEFDNSPELREILREQIYLWNLKKEEKEFCELVLQNLDERGLNCENPIFIGSCLISKNSKMFIWRKRLSELLHDIQKLEPIGCACDSPLQSLIIQAKLRFPNTELLRVLQSLPSLDILSGLEDLFIYLGKQGFNHAQSNQILKDLRKLEPYPARGYRVTKNSQNFRIYPEVQVSFDLKTNSIEIQLLNNLESKLCISVPKQSGEFQEYRRRQEIDLLLKQLRRREETLLRIAQSIFQIQKQFVIKGVKFLQKMTLQIIADDLNLHISTISRCIQNKYCKTPWGTYPLRFFFSPGLPNGQSREQVKERIVELYREYSCTLSEKNRGIKEKKLSDAKLSKYLEKFNIQISRRTVAKYRAELLNEGRLI